MRFALAILLLIGTTERSAFAQNIDDSQLGDGGGIVGDAVTPATPVSAGDADPGPRLPNGEPAPPPDLVADNGGFSCNAAGAVASPLPLLLALALLVRRRR